MGLFRSRQQQDVDVIRAKLADAEQAVTLAEQRLRDKALEAALSADVNAAAPQHEALRRANELVEVLRLGLADAEAAERQRIAKVKAELRQSQDRAIRQHLAAMFKAAQQ